VVVNSYQTKRPCDSTTPVSPIGPLAAFRGRVLQFFSRGDTRRQVAGIKPSDTALGDILHRIERATNLVAGDQTKFQDDPRTIYAVPTLATSGSG
jgi:hypothetical protein